MLRNAQWIGLSQTTAIRTCPTFTRDFITKQVVKKAELVATAIGVYEASINGVRIGNYVLAPGCTVYTERLQYQSYDITELIQTNNHMAITVGSGWHRGRISAGSPQINQTPCAVIATLILTYVDGTTETITTDEQWTVEESRILSSDLYDGEVYDATKKITQSEEVVLLPAVTTAKLIPQEGEIICEQECIKPLRLFTTPKGEVVLDFGQNLTGYPEITLLSANNGDCISLSFAEVLDADGNFYTENYRMAKAEFKYICEDGPQTYKPHFTFYGFRYVRLNDCPSYVIPENFTAIAVYSNIKRTGFIESSNNKINQLFSNILWSQRSNFLDIPTDCPQRDERMGWLGDAQVFAKTAGYNYNVKKFFEKWLADVRASQFATGGVPDIVPNFWQMNKSSTAWGDAITIIPWQMYLLYGDKKVLEDNFSAMERWVLYIKNDSLDEFLWTCSKEEQRLWGKHYGDWLALDAAPGSYKGATDDNFIASMFFAYSVQLLLKAGKVLGKDMSDYENLYEKIKSTFRKHFPVYHTQTEHVLALYFDFATNKQVTADHLAQMIKQNGNKLQTGFVGTPYLLYALSENGYAELAYTLLLQEEYPSWLYEVNHGATTIWEHWDGIRDDGTFWSKDMNSYNHYAYGSVADWIYTVAAGIKTSEEYPGFEKVLIAPTPDRRLPFLNVSVQTSQGTITSKWTCNKDSIRYEINTPVPASITIEEKHYDVPKGNYVFEKNTRNLQKLIN